MEGRFSLRHIRTSWQALGIVSVIAAAKCTLSHADLPDRDEAVQALRTRFVAAHVPSESELKFGDSWRCAHRSALEGSGEYGWFSAYFDFAVGFDPGTVRNLSSSQAPVFVLTETALLGEYRVNGEVSAVDHVRVSEDGKLLVETTSPTCSQINIMACLFFGWKQARSVDNYWQGVIAYRECVLE